MRSHHTHTDCMRFAIKGLLLCSLALVGCRKDDRGSLVMEPNCNNACGAPSATETAGTICCRETNACVAYDLDAICPGNFSICAGPDNIVIDQTCSVTCKQCIAKPALEQGLLATYLDIASIGQDRFAISGYSPGVPPASRYGDLVVTTWTPTSTSFNWEIVDGILGNGAVTNDPNGWRRGISAPGDDVGRWTSVAAHEDLLYVSYYDKDHGSLKLAAKRGDQWIIQVVDDEGDSGRYTSLAIDPSGKPVIAYFQVRQADTSGRLESNARVATATRADPNTSADWTFANVHTVPIQCRPQWCATGTTCVDTGMCVTPTTDCSPTCIAGQVCAQGQCLKALADPYVEDLPTATGLFNSLMFTPSGTLALAFYDRVNGNLMGAERSGSSWRTPFVIAGDSADGTLSSDAGQSASLFVDGQGTWHLTYVEGRSETLRYASVSGGTVNTQLIDDGTTDGTTVHTDGRHLVGDDSSIVVSNSGEIRVVYQDSTQQRAMVARRQPGASTWTIAILDRQDQTGFWLKQVLVDDISYVSTFFRNERAEVRVRGVRILQFQ